MLRLTDKETFVKIWLKLFVNNNPMNLFFYGMFLSLILPTVTYAQSFKTEYACDNSHINFKNQTSLPFKIDSAKPLSGTELVVERSTGSEIDLPPQGEISYKVHSNKMTWGESLGTITFSHDHQQYELFYLFGNIFGLGECTVRYDIVQQGMYTQWRTPVPSYTIDCQSSVIQDSTTLTCIIKSNAYSKKIDTN